MMSSFQPKSWRFAALTARDPASLQDPVVVLIEGGDSYLAYERPDFIQGMQHHNLTDEQLQDAAFLSHWYSEKNGKPCRVMLGDVARQHILKCKAAEAEQWERMKAEHEGPSFSFKDPSGPKKKSVRSVVEVPHPRDKGYVSRKERRAQARAEQKRQKREPVQPVPAQEEPEEMVVHLANGSTIRSTKAKAVRGYAEPEGFPWPPMLDEEGGEG